MASSISSDGEDGNSTPSSTLPFSSLQSSSVCNNNNNNGNSDNDDYQQQQRSLNYLKWIYDSKGRPCRNRHHAVQAMRFLMGQLDIAKNSTIGQISDQPPRPPLANVHGPGPLLLSDIPSSCRKPGVVVGIDEAGRGSVLGPMVYGAAFWNLCEEGEEGGGNRTIPKGFMDSKQLNDDTRSALLESLLANASMGFCSK